MEPTDTLSSYSGGFFTPDLSPSNETVPLDLGNFRDFNKNRPPVDFFTNFQFGDQTHFSAFSKKDFSMKDLNVEKSVKMEVNHVEKPDRKRMIPKIIPKQEPNSQSIEMPRR